MAAPPFEAGALNEIATEFVATTVALIAGAPGTVLVVVVVGVLLPPLPPPHAAKPAHSRTATHGLTTREIAGIKAFMVTSPDS